MGILKLRRLCIAVIVAALFLAVLPFQISKVNAGGTLIHVTRTVYTEVYDGTVYNNGYTYSTVHDATSGVVWGLTSFNLGGQVNNTGAYTLYRSWLFFDLSFLPSDANFTETILSLDVQSDYTSGHDFNVTLQRGLYSDAPHTPLVPSDYSKWAFSSDLGSRNTTTLTGAGRWNITVNTAGQQYFLNYKSYSQAYAFIGLRSDRDINNIPPSTSEYIIMWGRETGYSGAPILYLSYWTAQIPYNVYGAYNEGGTRDGAINVTAYRTLEAPFTFNLNGVYNFTAESGILLAFDLGYNESRIYYLRDYSEDIFVFRPSQPYTPYYFTVNDYYGMTNGYLESMINVNGTGRTVERWSLSVKGALPFMFTIGKAYKMRIVCDQGTVDLGWYDASSTYSYTLFVSEENFAWIHKNGENLTAAASRMNATYFNVTYSDPYLQTSWLYVGIYESGNTTAVYYQNLTATNAATVTWNYGLQDQAYYVYVAAKRAYATPTWQFVFSANVSQIPYAWDGLSIVGDTPFPASQFVSVGLILLVFAVGTGGWEVQFGMFSAWVAALFFAYLGWFTFPLAAQIATGVVCFIFIIAIQKERTATL